VHGTGDGTGNDNFVAHEKSSLKIAAGGGRRSRTLRHNKKPTTIKAIGKHAADIKNKTFVVVSFDTLTEELKLLKGGYCNVLIGQRPYAMGVKSNDMNMISLRESDI